MKCISILQPWAHLVMHGPKRWENRTWPTTYLGPVVIHAGKSKRAYPFGITKGMVCGDLEGVVAGTDPGTPIPDDLPFGCIIGIATLAANVPDSVVKGFRYPEVVR